MKEVNPLDRLRAFVRAQGGKQVDAAQALGIKPAYLSDLLNERRDFSPRILAKLGLKRVAVQDKGAAA